jgi:L-lactate dehydrogenase complex protein LldG
MTPPTPRRTLGTRTWLVPAVSARATWRMPTVGSVPLPPSVTLANARPAHFAHPAQRYPRPTAPGAPTTRTWRVPAATAIRPDPGSPIVEQPAVEAPTGSPSTVTVHDLARALVNTGEMPVTEEAADAPPSAPWTTPTHLVTTGEMPAFDRVAGAEALAVTGESPIVDLPPGGHVPRPSSTTWQVPIPPIGVWPEAWRHAGAGLEHGDRDRFLAQARQRLAGGVPINQVHPPPPLPGDAPAPTPTYSNVADDDLLGTFARAVGEAGGVCHLVEGTIPDTLLDHIVAELGGWSAVVSAEPEAKALGEKLAARGVEVSEATADAAAGATMGVTSAIAGVAATGSVVLDSRRAGGRLASLLPPVHLCVLTAERIVATPAEVLRGLGDDPDALPPSLVLVTGPSRTGDIEQLLTIGAHGPTALHVVVVS